MREWDKSWSAVVLGVVLSGTWSGSAAGRTVRTVPLDGLEGLGNSGLYHHALDFTRGRHGRGGMARISARNRNAIEHHRRRRTPGQRTCTKAELSLQLTNNDHRIAPTRLAYGLDRPKQRKVACEDMAAVASACWVVWRDESMRVCGGWMPRGGVNLTARRR
ncbi:hypothetical protein LXA43DRAFT_134670 [Ganoderma leucocontextum]|nr:hypothetical protein LXA43DRAFT_134670 [Ganoderma leucocontextum]